MFITAEVFSHGYFEFPLDGTGLNVLLCSTFSTTVFL